MKLVIPSRSPATRRTVAGMAYYVCVAAAGGLVWCGVLSIPHISMAGALISDEDWGFVWQFAVMFMLSTLLASLIFELWIRRRQQWWGTLLIAVAMAFLVAILFGQIFTCYEYLTATTPFVGRDRTIYNFVGESAGIAWASAMTALLSLHLAVPLAWGQIWLLRRIIRRPSRE